MNRSTERESYFQARARCNNPNNPGYKNYGGRGIRFLFSSFEQFYRELGNRPDGMQVDRINNNGHYEPGNVHWANKSEQMKNRRYMGKYRVRGVCRDSRRNRWRAYSFNSSELKHLGYFETELEAIFAVAEYRQNGD